MKPRPEILVRDTLQRHFTNIVHDSYLQGTRYRPDFIITRDHTALVIEVDEYAHARYDPKKERRRESVITHQLTNDGYDVVILRFNPNRCRVSKLLVDIVDIATRIISDLPVNHILTRLGAEVADHVIRVY